MLNPEARTSVGCVKRNAIRCGRCVSHALRIATALLLATPAARAQFGETVVPQSHFELSDTVQVDRVESMVLGQLERAKAQLAEKQEGQWDEAIETLRQIMESAGGKLVAVTPTRFVGLRDYCNLQLAALPPKALARYRGRVDPLARQWYEEGVATRNVRLLRNVVDQAFASSWSDKALLALGDAYLEEGDFAAARWCWERIVPQSRAANEAPAWLGYPDSKLDLAAVRTRLVLVSILEGSLARARDELAAFAKLHAQARGALGGREVVYVEALRTMLAEAADWPARKPAADWPTFAGDRGRNATASPLIDVAGVAWRVPLQKINPPFNAATASVAEEAEAPLSYHPVLVGDMVFVNNQAQVLAYRLSTGKPAWGAADPAIYRDMLEVPASELLNPRETLGTARFTLTAHEGRLFAHMGVALTGRPPEAPHTVGHDYLLCLDLAEEGKQLWRLRPDEGWAFEGAPLCDGANVFVAMRRNGVRPEAHVACFDVQSRQMRWRQFVCGAETPARGMLFECTHNLLTLHRGTLYYNTNLGAVAALSADDGRVRWVTLYPRARSGDLSKLAPHWQRVLTPCVYDRGTLLVAPADSPQIFGIDAGTGQLVWQTGEQVEDAVHLLGVVGDRLIASGRRLYWIGLKREDAGRIKRVWPDSNAQPGYGRGVLAGDQVLFPTREKSGNKVSYRIQVFDQKTAQLRKAIDLDMRGEPAVTGGNLLVADGQLLIATGTELVALRTMAVKQDGGGKLTQTHAPRSHALRGNASLGRSASAPLGSHAERGNQVFAGDTRDVP